MRTSIVHLCWLLSFSTNASAASCKRDACYKAVANQGQNSPNRAIRQEDCRSILRLRVEDDDVIATVISTITAAPATSTVIEISTSISATTRTTLVGRKRAESFYAGPSDDEPDILEARDKVVIKG